MQTPSGNFVIHASGTSHFTEIDASGAVIFDDLVEYSTNTFRKEDMEKWLSQWYTTSVTSYGNTCTSEFEFKIVNGKVIFDHYISGC